MTLPSHREGGALAAGSQVHGQESDDASLGRQLLPPETPGLRLGPGPSLGSPRGPRPAAAPASALPLLLLPAGRGFLFTKTKPKARVAAGAPRPLPSSSSARPLVASGEQRRLRFLAEGQASGKPISSPSRVQIKCTNLYILFGPQVHRLIIILGSQHSHTLTIGPCMASFLPINF